MNKGIIYALITALNFGFLSIAIKVATPFVEPVTIAWIRFSIALTALATYYAFFERKAFAVLRRPPLIVVFAAIALGLNYLGFITGIKYTSPSIAQVFIQIGPLLLAISGFVIFKEKATPWQIVGIITAFGGYLVFYNEQILVLAEDINRYQKGVLWVIFGGITWTVYTVLQKVGVRNRHPMYLNLIVFGIPALAFIPLVDFSSLYGLETWQWLLLVFLGLTTLVGYGCLPYALKYLAANKVSVIITSNPLITFVTMGILGSVEVSWIEAEKWSAPSIVGAAIVMSGVVLTVASRKR